MIVEFIIAFVSLSPCRINKLRGNRLSCCGQRPSVERHTPFMQIRLLQLLCSFTHYSAVLGREMILYYLCAVQVLSDTMVLTEEDGALSLIVRVGDTYPNQTLDTIVRVYLYRWPGHPLNKTADSRSKDYTVSPTTKA